jgi:14-3-3 protein epsilon
MPTDLPDLYLAKLAEQAGRFDDMLEHMRKVCTAREGALALEERNMLSVAFKNVVSQRRSSLRILSHLLKREADMGGKKTAQIQAYDTKIQVELQGLCNSIITLLDGSLIKKAENSEAKVFYLKMKADYFRCARACDRAGGAREGSSSSSSSSNQPTNQPTSQPTSPSQAASQEQPAPAPVHSLTRPSAPPSPALALHRPVRVCSPERQEVVRGPGRHVVREGIGPR